MHWNLDMVTWSSDLEFIYFNEIALIGQLDQCINCHEYTFKCVHTFGGFAGQLFMVVGLWTFVDLLFKHYYFRLGNQMFSLAGTYSVN